MKRIVRISKVDLSGDKQVSHTIRKIKGVDYMMSNALLNSLGINKKTLLGELPEEDIDKLKKAIESPEQMGLPTYLLNRQKDRLTGEDKHLTGLQVSLTEREDIKRMEDNRSRKGFRHALGLKVRGQRTRAHPRKGMAVGVVTKKKLAKMQKSGGDGKKKEAKKAAAKKGGKKK